MTTRLISADDHVDLSHDKIKSFLSPKFHDEYDKALIEFGRSMGATSSAQSNQRWREQQGLEVDYDYVPMRDRRAHDAGWPRRPHRLSRSAQGHGPRRRGIFGDLL